MATAPLELENAFWRFSLAVYATAGVAEECLALQDKSGIDINLLLFCAWVGTKRAIALTQSDILAADAAVHAWRNDVVRPLRGVRQALTRAESGDAGLRPRVKAIELEAEQIEQALLYGHARTHWPEVCLAVGANRVVVNVRTFMQAVGSKTTELDEVALPKKLIDAARELTR